MRTAAVWTVDASEHDLVVNGHAVPLVCRCGCGAEINAWVLPMVRLQAEGKRLGEIAPSLGMSYTRLRERRAMLNTGQGATIRRGHLQGLRPQCSVEGCDLPHFGRGFCNTHYDRYRRRGTTDAPNYLDKWRRRIPDPVAAWISEQPEEHRDELSDLIAAQLRDEAIGMRSNERPIPDQLLGRWD